MQEDGGTEGERSYGSVGALEHIELGLSGSELVSWDNTLENLLYELPELIVLILEKENDAGALAVE